MSPVQAVSSAGTSFARCARGGTRSATGGSTCPTPTGGMIRGVARGRYRAYPRIGLNIVDVRDVARAHVLALEHGRPGERYLLGGVDLTMRELFAAVADLAGRPRPRVAVPSAAI